MRVCVRACMCACVNVNSFDACFGPNIQVVSSTVVRLFSRVRVVLENS